MEDLFVLMGEFKVVDVYAIKEDLTQTEFKERVWSPKTALESLLNRNLSTKDYVKIINTLWACSNLAEIENILKVSLSRIENQTLCFVAYCEDESSYSNLYTVITLKIKVEEED